MRTFTWPVDRVRYEKILKRGTHLGFNAMKILKKISLALLTHVET